MVLPASGQPDLTGHDAVWLRMVGAAVRCAQPAHLSPIRVMVRQGQPAVLPAVPYYQHQKYEHPIVNDCSLAHNQRISSAGKATASRV